MEDPKEPFLAYPHPSLPGGWERGLAPEYRATSPSTARNSGCWTQVINQRVTLPQIWRAEGSSTW